MADIFCNLDVRCINHGFKKTESSFFQSEPAIENQLSRKEQVMNLIERFDKFACLDSYEDKFFELRSPEFVTQNNI